MITEMNCSPDPQWLKDFKKEIQEEYKLTSLDAACIAGKVAKIVRKRDEKACGWLKANIHNDPSIGTYVDTVETLVEDFVKEVEKQL